MIIKATEEIIMTEELVSIVIPVYNVKAYLEQCVHSAVNQSYQALEIILVDDGSTDGSGELCEELSLKDSRITVYHKTNGGLSSARNYGMARSNGRYIYFLDSDDYIEADTIKILVYEIRVNKMDFIAFCGQCFMDDTETGTEVTILDNVYKKKEGRYGICSGAQLFNNLKKNKEYYPAVPMHLYDKGFLKKNSLTFKEGILHEDELFSILAYYFAERVGCSHKSLYHRRMRSNSIMAEKVDLRNVSSCIEILKSIEELIDCKNGKNNPKNVMIRKGYAHCLWLFFIRYSKLNHEDRKAVKEEYRALMDRIKRCKYYGSNEIRSRYRRRVLATLRNSKTLYRAFNFIRNKRTSNGRSLVQS